MLKIDSLKELRGMPDSLVKRVMEAKAVQCHDGDEEIISQMEEGFDGGSWHVFEEGDDPRSFAFDDDCPADLLSEEWSCCETATLEGGFYFVFWSTTNAGGPCLFVADAPWVPAELRARLNAFVAGAFA